MTSRRYTSEEAEQWTQRIALVTASGLPLASGLHAAAGDGVSPRVAAALEDMAGQVGQGRSLAEVLTNTSALLPPHTRGALLAAARTGELGRVLPELIEQQQAARALWRTVAGGLAYPLLVLCLAVTVCIACFLVAVGPFRQMFLDFGLRLPVATRFLIWLYDGGLALLLGFVPLAAVVLVGIRWWIGRASWSRLTKWLPLFGPLWHWSALADWAGLLTVLLRHQVPLPEALRLSAHGVADADVGRIVSGLADGVERGEPLSQSAATAERLPSVLLPLLRWGEKQGMLADALTAGREMLTARVRIRAALVQSILPPFLFVAIGCGFILLVIALFMPLVSMIDGLS